MSKKNILITARDVGAALNIIEIIKYASTQESFNLHVYIQPPASYYFTHANIAHNKVPHCITKSMDDENSTFLLNYAKTILDATKPDIILSGLSTPGDGGIDEAIISVAKNKVPSFIMQDFWGEVNDFFGVAADYYLCLDDRAKQLTEKKNSSKAIVIGSPRHSWYNSINIDQRKTELRAHLNLSSETQIIGLFGQSLHHIPGYQQTIIEFLYELKKAAPDAMIAYRKHPRESEAHAGLTIQWLEQSGSRFFLAEHKKVENSLIVCDVVCNILSNSLYDAAYLNYFSEKPLITPVALCYKPDIRLHLNNYNMIDASPYKNKKFAYVCDNITPDKKIIDSLLSQTLKEELWLASKQLENPQVAAKKALQNLLEMCC